MENRIKQSGIDDKGEMRSSPSSTVRTGSTGCSAGTSGVLSSPSACTAGVGSLLGVLDMVKTVVRLDELERILGVGGRRLCPNGRRAS